jgi:hypothetical protein
MKTSNFPIGINQQTKYFPDIFVHDSCHFPKSTSFDAARRVLSKYVQNIPIIQIKVALKLQKPSKIAVLVVFHETIRTTTRAIDKTNSIRLNLTSSID